MSHLPQYENPAPGPADARALIADTFRQATRLIQAEVELAKREMKSKVSRAGWGFALMVLAGFLVITALDILAAALVTGIAAMGLPIWAASLLVAAITIGLGVLLFVIGRKRIMPETLVPDETVDSLKKDIETIKETTHVQ